MKRDWRYLAALSVVSAVLLAFQLGDESLWLDEMMSLDVARASWPDFARFFVSMPEQHPVYYLLLKPWLVFGTTEVALRAFSVVFAVGSLWLLYQLTLELLDGTTARVASALLAVSPFAIYYGQEARMYALELFLTLLSTLCLVRWLAAPSRARAVLYVAVSIVGVYTHFFFFFLLLAHSMYVLISNRGLRGPVLSVLLLQTVIVMAYVPWAVLIATHMPQGQVWKTWRHIAFGIPYTLLRFELGYGEFVANHDWQSRARTLVAENLPVLASAATSLIAIGGAGAFRLWNGAGRLVMCGAVVPMVAAVAASVVMILVGERYFVVSFPFYLIIMASGIRQLWESHSLPLLRRGAVILFALVTVKALHSHYFNPRFGKEQWGEVARLLERQAQPGDVVVAHEAYTARMLDYYGVRRAALAVYPSNVDWTTASCAARRTWLIESHSRDSVPFRSRFTGTHRLVAEQLFPFQSGIVVALFERDPGPAADQRCAAEADVTSARRQGHESRNSF